MRGNNNILHNLKNLSKEDKPNDLLKEISNLNENIKSELFPEVVDMGNPRDTLTSPQLSPSAALQK